MDITINTHTHTHQRQRRPPAAQETTTLCVADSALLCKGNNLDKGKRSHAVKFLAPGHLDRVNKLLEHPDSEPCAISLKPSFPSSPSQAVLHACWCLTKRPLASTYRLAVRYSGLFPLSSEPTPCTSPLNSRCLRLYSVILRPEGPIWVVVPGLPYRLAGDEDL